MSQISDEIKRLRRTLNGRNGNKYRLTREWVDHFNELEPILHRVDPDAQLSTPEQKQELATYFGSTGLGVKSYNKRIAPKILTDLGNSQIDRDI